MRCLLLPICLLFSAPLLAGPDQRTTVGDGGLGDLLGMIASEQPGQNACQPASVAQALSAQEHALDAADAMGCKAIASHMQDLSALSRRAGECQDGALQQRAGSLGAQYRAIENQRCQAGRQDAAGQIAGIAELGLTQAQQRADAKAARREEQLRQGRLAEQARQQALAQQREIAARAVTTTSSNPYANNTSQGSVTSGSDAGSDSGVPAPPAPGQVSSRPGSGTANTGNRRSSFTYDDTNHSQCLSIRATGQNSGSRMAYGHYQLTNRCSYPITAHICTVSDNADGSPSDSWNKFQDGAPCPGGWGGASFKAGETQNSKTWFEFRNIRFHAYICREGWSIVNMQDKSVYLIGERYRCRIYR